MIQRSFITIPLIGKAVTIFLFVLLFSRTTQAATYYLTTTGNDSNAGTSLTTGFASFSYAISKLVAGDLLYVRTGTYTCGTRVECSKSGSAGKLITVMAYPSDIVVASDRPILNFTGMAAGSSNQGLHVTGGYWYIKGLRIRGAGDNGMLMETAAATQNIVEFCDFYENRDAGCQIRKSASNDQFINCDAYNNADMGTGTTSNGGNADGFSPKLDLGENIAFTNCRSWANSDDGWDGYLKCTEAGLPDNMTTYLTNCWAFNNGHYWLDGTTNTDMNGNGIKMGGSTNKDQAHNFIVKNCLSYNNKSKGFDQNNNAGSITLYNCTSVKNGAQDFALNSSGVTYAANSVFTVINCVEFGTTGTAFKTGTTLTTNNFATASTDYASVDSTGLSAQRKPDGSLPDITFMHPKTGSKLIDVGTNVGIAFNGSKPDLGYWETPSLTTTINQNINLVVGWNLISFNVSPTNKSVDSIFKAVITNVTEIKTADGFWRSGQTSILNSLKTVSDGAAYLVNMKAAATITVSGLALTPSIGTIKTGWQLTGCPYQASTAITTAFTTTTLQTIKNFTSYWSSTGTGTLLNIDPGKGYFVKGK
jgi:hypothetical protein